MIKVNPGKVKGQIYAQAEKNEFQRVLAIAAISNKVSYISYTTKCNDVNTAIGILKNLGCSIHETKGKILVVPRKKRKRVSFQCRESGLLAGMFSPIGALLFEEVTIEGEGSLLNTNMVMVGVALFQLKSEVNSLQIPFTIKGPMTGGNVITIDGSCGAQLLTGLLISLPFLNANRTIVNVKELTNKPHIDLTLAILDKAGVMIKRIDYNQFIIPGLQKIHELDVTIEGDWSSAAFFLVAGAIAGTIALKGLNLNSKQVNKKILTILKLAGAKIEIKEDEIKVKKSYLSSFFFDATTCPDLFPPIAVLAAYCDGRTTIKGAKRLLNKESNRIESLISLFTTLGIEIIVEDDIMVITGGKVNGCAVSLHNDDRIAMAAAIAALGADGPIKIDGHEAVDKSFPDFFKILSQIQNYR